MIVNNTFLVLPLYLPIASFIIPPMMIMAIAMSLAKVKKFWTIVATFTLNALMNVIPTDNECTSIQIRDSNIKVFVCFLKGVC